MADLGLPPIDVFKLVQTGDSLHHLINTKGKCVRPIASVLIYAPFGPTEFNRNDFVFPSRHNAQ